MLIRLAEALVAPFGACLFVINFLFLMLTGREPWILESQWRAVALMVLGELLMMIGWVLIPVFHIRRRTRRPNNGCEVTQ